MKRVILAGFAVVVAAVLQADAQTAVVVGSCGSVPGGAAYSAGNVVPLTIDTNGKLCSALTAGSATTVVIGTSPITGGASTQVLFNNGGLVSSDAGLTKVAGATGTVTAGGTLTARNFMSAGTVPTGNTGTCSTGVTVAGGATAGTWTSTAACALAGTIILTAMPAATTGYACFISDRTTAGVTIEQTATSTTSATFTVRSLPTGSVQAAANDILQYSCMGY